MALNFPASPTDGQTYVAPNGVTYVYDATDTLWRAQAGDGENVVFVSATAPVAPTNGKMWWNTDTGTMFIWYNDGNSGQWVPATTPGPAGIQPGQDLEVNSLVSSGDVQAASVNGGHAGPNNLIINGGFTVAQRGTSGTETQYSNYLTCDRWRIQLDSASQASFTKETSGGPSGFPNYFRWNVDSVDSSIGTASNVYLNQRIEGLNLQSLGYGTTSAKALTMSFYVKGNRTGTYVLEITNPNGGRHIAKTYTIDTADTWEYKTITFPGDTTNSIADNNSEGFRIKWWLQAGTNFTSGTLPANWDNESNANRAAGQTVNLHDTAGSNWNITGVQLTATDTAVAFQHEDYATTLYKCQRYYQVIGGLGRVAGAASSPSTVVIPIPIPAPLRTTPSLLSNSLSQMKRYDATGVSTGSATFTVGNFSEYKTSIDYQVSGITVIDNAVYWVTLATLRLDAEL